MEPFSNLSLKNSTLIDWRDQTAGNYVDDNTGSCCGPVDVETVSWAAVTTRSTAADPGQH